ncbi:MAG: hypothetical protein MUO91_02075 [candidate division Zixibacteria bacterium]|nr:hypothetical protein [candidate division Zixibacteria bacterium]
MRPTKVILFWAFWLCLSILACAPATENKTTLEIPFKKIGHFMVGRYEVGAIEYEPYMLPAGYIQLYYFPVYVEDKRIRDFYVNLYGNPEDFQIFGKKKVTKQFIMNQPFLWLLEEKTEKDPHLVKKRYEGAVEYERIKEDLVKILSE